MSIPTKKLGVVRQLALNVLSFVMTRGLLPVIRWIGKNTFAVPPPGAPGEPAEYIQPAARINPIVLTRARDDMAVEFAADPEGQQAELNACLESIRSEQIKGGLLRMFGSLVAAEMPPDEAIMRVCANFLLMGVFLERRIAKPVPSE